ncbi:MAG: hypothetical protein ABWX89_08985 [Paeniglutamicibacter terrestris]
MPGEIKSMRTARLLGRIMDETRVRFDGRLYLETGSDDFFAFARRLYRRHGFRRCWPFRSFGADPDSVFVGMSLAAGGCADPASTERWGR